MGQTLVLERIIEVQQTGLHWAREFFFFCLMCLILVLDHGMIPKPNSNSSSMMENFLGCFNPSCVGWKNMIRDGVLPSKTKDAN